MNNLFPTICALATPKLNCAIHIIRISGTDCFKIVNKILNKPINKQGYTIFHRLIVDNKNVIDDVLLNCFVAPKSYTGEDTIEINCHGGVIVADNIIRLLIKHGCKLAKRGEFTMRALMNKKIDLAQSEAINNLIHAQNQTVLRGSINSLLGKTSEEIKKIREDLFDLIGKIEVNIDYPEYEDIEQITKQSAIELTNSILKKLNYILINSRRFTQINNGIKVAILGEPNAGKSTLLNALSRTDKAIVSDIPGTTRDVIETTITIDDITLNIFDTAGIRKTNDELENIGINKAINLLEIVDLVLLLKPINTITDDWLNEYKNFLQNKKYLIVYTKSDLSNKEIKLNKNETIVCAKNNEVDELLKKISHMFEVEELLNSDLNVLQSEYQVNLLEQTIYFLNECKEQLNTNPLDLIIELYVSALENLNKILGIDSEYDFLDELFQKFCLGK